MKDVSIDKFISMFKAGYASANRYEVEFYLPKGIGATHGINVEDKARSGNIHQVQTQYNGNQKVNILCHTASMPQRSLLTYTHRQLNAPINVPYSQEYQPVSFIFYGDGNMEVREYFDIWQQAVVNIRSNTLNFMSEYVADVIIHQLDKSGNRTYSVRLYEAYPSMVSALDYSSTNTNQIQNVSIVLMYKYWSQIETSNN